MLCCIKDAGHLLNITDNIIITVYYYNGNWGKNVFSWSEDYCHQW